MIFLTLVLLRGGDEGALPIRTVAFNIGVSPATVSNYFYHCTFALHDMFMLACPIVWPSAAERREMESLVNGFPSRIIFVDGTKVFRWRPTDAQEQLRAYDGHHHFHCFSVLVWRDFWQLVCSELCGHLGRHVRHVDDQKRSIPPLISLFSCGGGPCPRLRLLCGKKRVDLVHVTWRTQARSLSRFL